MSSCKNNWHLERPTGLFIKAKANPELLAEDNLRRAGLSPAVDYWHCHEECKNLVVVPLGTATVIAFSNKQVEDKAPAEVTRRAYSCSSKE